MNAFRKYVVAATIGGASVAVYLVGSNFVQNVKFARGAEDVAVTRKELSTVSDLSNVFKAIGKVVEPSVVNIQVHKTVHGVSGNRVLPFDEDTLRKFFPDRDGDGQPDVPEGFGGGGNFEQVGTGSGVIMEVEDGAAYILTNNHVAGGASELDITLSDGREITNGKVLGTDPKSDLAVIKIEADKLIPAKWGNSDDLDRGDWVLAFGSPFGYVGSMTHGIVSALNRQAGILDQQTGYENFIQVDAPINPGNSGGPLVNLRGEVIGINTAIASRSGGSVGIGFAIPSNQAKFVYSSIKSSGHVTRGWLGVGIKDVSSIPGATKALNYTDNDGVLVEQTFANTPADGKLKHYDIITKVDGKHVANTQQLRNQVAITEPGKETTLTVFRDGKEVDVKIKMGEQPDDLTSMRGTKKVPVEPEKKEPVEANVESLGMRLSAPSDAMLDRFKITTAKEGALVTGVLPRSLAFKAGIRVGDLITEVDKKKVTSIEEARDAMKKGDLNKGILVYVVNAQGSQLAVLKKDDAK